MRKKHVFVLIPIDRDYENTPIVFLGVRPSKIQKELLYHWDDVLEYPGDFDNEHLENVGHIISKAYTRANDIMEDYNRLINEELTMERWLLEE